MEEPRPTVAEILAYHSFTPADILSIPVIPQGGWLTEGFRVGDPGGGDLGSMGREKEEL